MSSEWVSRPFSEVATLAREKAAPSDIGPNAAYIGLEHIQAETLRLQGLGQGSDVASTKARFQAGDVLFGKLRPYFRKVFRPAFGGVCSTDIWVLRPTEGVDPGYLFYLVSDWRFIDFVNSGSTGTRMPRANWRHAGGYQVSLPPIEEQRAVAEVLGALDDRIEHLSDRARLFDELMQAVYLQLEQSSTEKVRLADVVSLNPRTPLRRGETAPYLDMAALPESGFLPGEIGMRPFGSGVRFREGDVLLARITPCLENGKTGIVPPLEGNVGWGSTEFIVLRSDESVSGLVYGLSRSAAFRDFAVQRMNGSSGRQRVKAEDIGRYEVPDFSSPLARQLGSLANDWIQAGMAARSEMATIAELRDALLPKLLSGELRIESPERLLEDAS